MTKKKGQPLISVLMTSYNHEDWIGYAIKSVLNQSFEDLELIIVDDSSSDNSRQTIKKYAASDSRIKYSFNKKNIGAVETAKIAFDMSSSNYIAVISSDDTWELNKLDVQYDFLEKNNHIGALFATASYIDKEGNHLRIKKNEFADSVIKRNKEEWIKYFFYEGNCLCHPSILIRKECYETCGFYDARFRALPDFDMWIRLISKYEIETLNDPFVNFRVHSFNESKTNDINLLRGDYEYLLILESFLKFFISNPSFLTKVFPEIKKSSYYKNILKNEDVILLFSKYLLSNNQQSARIFAINNLKNLIAPSKNISNNQSYTPTDFQDDLIKSDLYGGNNTDEILFKIPFLLTIKKIRKLTPNRLSVLFFGTRIFRFRLKK